VVLGVALIYVCHVYYSMVSNKGETISVKVYREEWEFVTSKAAYSESFADVLKRLLRK